MNLTRTAELTTVTLSRRNLEGLIAQLDALGPASISRRIPGAGLVFVVAEEDAAHYNATGRDGRAGSSAEGQVYGERVEP